MPSVSIKIFGWIEATAAINIVVRGIISSIYISLKNATIELLNYFELPFVNVRDKAGQKRTSFYPDSFTVISTWTLIHVLFFTNNTAAGDLYSTLLVEVHWLFLLTWIFDMDIWPNRPEHHPLFRTVSLNRRFHWSSGVCSFPVIQTSGPQPQQERKDLFSFFYFLWRLFRHFLLIFEFITLFREEFFILFRFSTVLLLN